VRLVQGIHPIEVKPDATKGCGGRFIVAYSALSSSSVAFASGLNFSRAPSASTTGMAARSPPWKRLRPLIQPSNDDSARASGSTLRMKQH